MVIHIRLHGPVWTAKTRVGSGLGGWDQRAKRVQGCKQLVYVFVCVDQNLACCVC